MPGLALHMTIARTLAADLDSARIDADRGAYYLGATTPDIRALTRWDRERTHFFNLDDFEEQSGVHRLFEQEASLRDANALDEHTAAFIAGYISHLVMDEEYIKQIYRPLFGERSALCDDAMSDVLDKVLQWDIERADREDLSTLADIREALAQTAVDVNVEFIAKDALMQWRDMSVDMISQAPSVERLVRFLGRRLPHFQFEDEDKAAQLADEVPVLLRRAWEHVGEERVREYLEDGKGRARTAMREYLS